MRGAWGEEGREGGVDVGVGFKEMQARKHAAQKMRVCEGRLCMCVVSVVWGVMVTGGRGARAGRAGADSATHMSWGRQER